jgi:CDP-4-dehydro-6-deoxyglucose reductase
MQSSLDAPETQIAVSRAVRLLETSQSFLVEPGESVLDGALRAAIDLPHECQSGLCGSCRVKLVEGSVIYADYPAGLTTQEEAEGYALACQAHACSDLVVSIERTAPCADPEQHVAIVKQIRPLSADVTHLTLELPDGPPPAHRPGQYLKIFMEDGRSRSFSMASIPNGRTVDLHIRKIPGGFFTDAWLARMQAGDTLHVELPLGSFYHREQDYRPLLMVATGTGLAPIKSILESLMDNPDCPPVSLYWGARTVEDLYLHEQIQAWGERLYDFQYVPVLSRADAAWSGRRGHVQHAVVQDLPDLSEHALYLCGSPNMINDAKQLFLSLGAKPAYIYSDSFTFELT